MTNRLLHHQLMKGYLFAISATAIWSGNFIVARGLRESIPPVSLAFWRWFVAVIVFAPFALKALIREWPVVRKNMVYLSVTALLGITIFNTLIYIAGHTTAAINLSLISISFPVFIVILSRIFFHELITVTKGTGIILVAAGIVCLITKGEVSNLLNISFSVGDLWMLAAAITFAVYSMLLKYKPRQLSIRTFQFSTFVLGLMFLFPFFVWEHVKGPAIGFNAANIVSILYVGILASLTAFVLWNKAVVIVGPSKAAMIYYTLPVFSALLAHVFLKEAIGIIHFYSVLLIITGIITANYEKNAG